MPEKLKQRLCDLLLRIYPNADIDALSEAVLAAFWPRGLEPRKRPRKPGNALWSQHDAVLITYGNSLLDGTHKPLDLLYHFLCDRLKGVVNGVHILPFFPCTSDDGFAVTGFSKVDPALGDWPDMNASAAPST